jgi:hypothetical protein
MTEDQRNLSALKFQGLRAEIEPLDGRKYYGSSVALKDASGETKDAVVVWVMGDYTPSERELEAWDEEEYGPYEVCDSHFESALGYEICQAIVKAINGDE